MEERRELKRHLWTSFSTTTIAAPENLLLSSRNATVLWWDQLDWSTAFHTEYLIELSLSRRYCVNSYVFLWNYQVVAFCFKILHVRVGLK